jgi:hypothetical protein
MPDTGRGLAHICHCCARVPRQPQLYRRSRQRSYSDVWTSSFGCCSATGRSEHSRVSSDRQLALGARQAGGCVTHLEETPSPLIPLLPPAAASNGHVVAVGVTRAPNCIEQRRPLVRASERCTCLIEHAEEQCETGTGAEEGRDRARCRRPSISFSLHTDLLVSGTEDVPVAADRP